MFSREIAEAISSGRVWGSVSEGVVNNAANRMAKKGLLAVEKRGGINNYAWYSPTQLGPDSLEEAKKNRQRLSGQSKQAFV